MEILGRKPKESSKCEKGNFGHYYCCIFVACATFTQQKLYSIQCIQMLLDYIDLAFLITLAGPVEQGGFIYFLISYFYFYSRRFRFGSIRIGV
jgi:hypothetical protein